MVTVPPISAEAQSFAPSGENSTKRGRWSTSVLSARVWVLVSIQCSMLVVSLVLTAHLPSGLTAMPSGSMPTSICPSTLSVTVSITVTSASSSLDTYSQRSLGCRANCSGSLPEGSSLMILRVATSITCTRSESLAQMYSSLLSCDSSKPRGRWPTGRVSVTSSVCRSIRLRLLSFSLETQAVAAMA
ncbi:hypothetical protein D9M73_187760 [compost metagenome]